MDEHGRRNKALLRLVGKPSQPSAPSRRSANAWKPTPKPSTKPSMQSLIQTLHELRVARPRAIGVIERIARSLLLEVQHEGPAAEAGPEPNWGWRGKS